MAVMRDRPYTGSNFLVDLGLGDPHAFASGFSEVVFPAFDVPAAHTAADAPLILRRGFSGALDLAKWWAEGQAGKPAQPRTATIQLLDEQHVDVVMTWRFRNVRPLRLTYSPLDANHSALVIETIELAFDAVEMH